MATQIEFLINPVGILAAQQAANAALGQIEDKTGQTFNALQGAFQKYADVILKVNDVEHRSMDRVVAGIERQAAAYGKTGVERLVAQRDHYIKQLGTETELIDRVTKAYDKMIATQSKPPDSRGFAAFGENIKNFIEHPFQSAQSAATGLLEKLGPVGVGLAAITTGAVAAGAALFEIAKGAGEAAERIVNLSASTGLEIKQVDQLSAMARLVGIDLQGLVRIGGTLTSTLEGGGAKAETLARHLREIGVSAHDSALNLKEPGPLIEDILRGLSQIPDRGERVTKTFEVLPRRLAGAFLPLIQDLDGLQRAVQQMGYGLDEHGIKKAAEFEQQIHSLELRWEMAKRSLAKPIEAIFQFIFGDAVPKPRTAGGEEYKPSQFLQTFFPGVAERRRAAAEGREPTSYSLTPSGIYGAITGAPPPEDIGRRRLDLGGRAPTIQQAAAQTAEAQRKFLAQVTETREQEQTARTRDIERRYLTPVENIEKQITKLKDVAKQSLSPEGFVLPGKEDLYGQQLRQINGLQEQLKNVRKLEGERESFLRSQEQRLRTAGNTELTEAQRINAVRDEQIAKAKTLGYTFGQLAKAIATENQIAINATEAYNRKLDEQFDKGRRLQETTESRSLFELRQAKQPPIRIRELGLPGVTEEDIRGDIEAQYRRRIDLSKQSKDFELAEAQKGYAAERQFMGSRKAGEDFFLATLKAESQERIDGVRAELEKDQQLEALRVRARDIEVKFRQEMARIRTEEQADEVRRTATLQARQVQITIGRFDPLRAIREEQAIRIDEAHKLTELELERIKQEETGNQAAISARKALFQLNRDINAASEEALLKQTELIQRQRDSISQTSQGLLHTLFTDRQRFGAQFRETIHNAFLRPIEEGLGNMIGRGLQPLIFGAGGGGGIAGSLKGIFGGGQTRDPIEATRYNTNATDRNTEAILQLTHIVATGGRSLPGPQAAVPQIPFLGGETQRTAAGTPFTLSSTPGFIGQLPSRAAMQAYQNRIQSVLFAEGLGGGGVPLQGAPALPGYQGGGIVAETGPAYVHEGEAIIPAPVTREIQQKQNLEALQRFVGYKGQGQWQTGEYSEGQGITGALKAIPHSPAGGVLATIFGKRLAEAIVEPKWREAERLIHGTYGMRVDHRFGQAVADVAVQKYGGRVSIAVMSPEVRHMLGIHDMPITRAYAEGTLSAPESGMAIVHEGEARIPSGLGGFFSPGGSEVSWSDLAAATGRLAKKVFLAPGEGAREAYAGAQRLGDEFNRAIADITGFGFTGKTPRGVEEHKKEVLSAINQITRGASQAAIPFAAVGGIAAPARTVAGLIAGAVSQSSSTKMATALGASPELAELIGTGAGVVGGGLGMTAGDAAALTRGIFQKLGTLGGLMKEVQPVTGVQFVSPSRISTTFDEALGRLPSPQQREALAAVARINRSLGLTSKEMSVVGDTAQWQAENAIMSFVRGGSPEAIRAGAASAGLEFGQASVGHFTFEQGGPDYLYRLKLKGDEISARALTKQFGFADASVGRTQRGATDIFVIDQGGQLSPQLQRLAAHADAVRMDAFRGRGGFLGADTPEAAAPLFMKASLDYLQKSTAARGQRGAITYSPKGSVREAQDWVRGNLFTNAIFSGQNVEIANTVAAHLTEASNRGLQLPQEVTVDPTAFRTNSTMARYVPDTYFTDKIFGRLDVNPNAEYWSNPAKRAAELHTEGHISTGDPFHVITHELGHSLFDQKSRALFLKAANTPIVDPHLQAIIGREVSSYALTNQGEFVAEVFAARHLGRKFSDAINRLYDEAGGPPIMGGETGTIRIQHREFGRPREFEWAKRMGGGPISTYSTFRHGPSGSILNVGREADTGYGLVDWAHVPDRFRGQGIAQQLYIEALKQGPLTQPDVGPLFAEEAAHARDALVRKGLAHYTTDQQGRRLLQALGLEGERGALPIRVREIEPQSFAAFLAGNPAAGTSLFDLLSMQRAMPEREFQVPRYNPPRGVPARMAEALENPAVKRGFLKAAKAGEALGMGSWYRTAPLYEAFNDILGPSGPQAFERFIDYVAATSPGSRVKDNVAIASYYYHLDRQGLPIPATPAAGYGSKLQQRHRLNAIRIREGGMDPFVNPKPFSFRENFLGNETPVTIDTHNMRLLGLLAKDPRFLNDMIQVPYRATSGKMAYANYKPREAFQRGQLNMEKALKDPTLWESAPAKTEYAAFESFQQGLAKKMGMTPAEFQANVWVGAGEKTGLGSAPEPFLKTVVSRIEYTADQMGRTTKEVLARFIRGDIPLYQQGGVVPSTGAALLHEGEAVLPRGLVSALSRIGVIQEQNPQRDLAQAMNTLTGALHQTTAALFAFGSRLGGGGTDPGLGGVLPGSGRGWPSYLPPLQTSTGTTGSLGLLGTSGYGLSTADLAREVYSKALPQDLGAVFPGAGLTTSDLVGGVAAQAGAFDVPTVSIGGAGAGGGFGGFMIPGLTQSGGGFEEGPTFGGPLRGAMGTNRAGGWRQLLGGFQPAQMKQFLGIGTGGGAGALAGGGVPGGTPIPSILGGTDLAGAEGGAAAGGTFGGGTSFSSVAGSPAVGAAGLMLAEKGLMPGSQFAGTATGLIMGTAGGAAVGFQYGGPIGAAVGAGVGFGIGLGEMVAGVEPQWKEAERLVRQTYHINIPHAEGQKIADIANQSYGGRVSIAVRAPEVRHMLGLYAAGTGQNFPASANEPHALSLVEQGGSLYQAPTYQYGKAYSYNSNLPTVGGYSTQAYPNPAYPSSGGGAGAGTMASAGGPTHVTLMLNGQAAADLLAGKVGEVADPRFVQDQYSQALAMSDGRLPNAAALNQPGLIIS